MRIRWIIILALVSHYCFAQTSPHGEVRFKCAVCHTSESWKMRTDSAFDHSVTGFTLTGQHAKVACASCHENLVFGKQSQDCLSCHTDIHKSELGKNCLRCHSTETWVIADMRERHQQTRFPLQGKHLITNCAVCHNRPSPNQYAGTPLECIGCHRSEYLGTTSPPHVQNGFGIDCAQCHLTTSLTWPSGFNHSLTAFPLTGAHRTILCDACHTNNNFTKIPSACFDCHQGNFIATTNPPHASGGFSHDCLQCHNTTAWQPATFDHNTTKFPLTGAHITLDCQSCHINGNYALVYQSCYQCHQAEFQGTTNPNHVTAGYSHDCQTCHTTTTWGGAAFDHSTTHFPLTGAHLTIQCSACHGTSNYSLVYTDCYQCHSADYAKPTDPNHAQANFSHICTPCHTTTVWTGGTFDHSTTKLPLTGAHIALTCSTCHNGNYTLVYTDCYQCHSADFARPTDPNHVTANFSHICTPCHTTTVWTGGTFDHSKTNFPLTGAHLTTTCVACHAGNYTLVYTDCYQCHSDKFIAQTNPNHVSANFSHTCTPCHTTTVWTGGTYTAHDAQYFKIYSGRHNGQWTSCAQCHQDNTNYATFTCLTCHGQSSTTSEHSGVSGFVYASANCYSCHRNV